MKNWIKYLGISLGLGATTVVPMTAISFSDNKSLVSSDGNTINGDGSNDNGNNNNGNDGDNQNPGGDSGGGVVDGGGNTPVEPAPEVVQPILAKSITRNTNFNELYSSDHTDILENVTNIVNSSQKEQLITNYEKLSETQKENITISLEAQITSNNWQGDAEYNTWQRDTTKVIYNGDQINIQSPDELYTYLTTDNKLDEIMNSIISEQTGQYRIVSGSKLGLTDTGLHINLQKVSMTYSSEWYDFVIPLSSLNLELHANVVVSGNDIETQKGKVDLVYDINVNMPATKIFERDTIIKASKARVVDVLGDLRWWTDNSTIEGGYGLEEDIEIDNNTHNKILNQNKIANDLEIYNVTFSNPRLELLHPEHPLHSDEYDGKHKIIFNVTPKEGFTWENGQREERTLTIESIFVRLKLTDWTPNGLALVNKYDIKDQSVDIGNVNALNDYFNIEVNLNKLKEHLNEILKTNKQDLKYLTIELEKTNDKWVYDNTTQKRGMTIRALLKFKVGYDYKVDGIDFNRARFDITLTNSLWQTQS